MTRPDAGPISAWWFVVLGAAVMGVAGTYQFVWSSLSDVIGARMSTAGAALGTVYTLFIAAQTLSQFPAGRLRDRYGPRVLVAVAGVLLGGGYLGTAFASGIGGVYVSYVTGGIGAGIAYTVAINTPVKWFSERQGLATGIVGMAYGGLSVFLIPSVRASIDTAFVRTLLALGVGALVVCLVGAVVLRDPSGTGTSDAGEASGSSGDPESLNDEQSNDSPADAYSWREAAGTWQFWLLYVVFVVVNGVGLMIIGKVVSFASALELSATVATGAASALALADGAGVVIGGAISDKLGAERTAAGTLVLCGMAIAGATLAGADGFGVVFVVLLGAAAFFRSPVFAVFPTIVGDYYGVERSSENYAALYSSKVWGGVIGGTVTSALIGVLGWTPSFLLSAVVMSVAGVALFALRPVKRADRASPARRETET